MLETYFQFFMLDVLRTQIGLDIAFSIQEDGIYRPNYNYAVKKYTI